MTIREALASRNGGPGLTAEELVQITGKDRAAIRATMSRLVLVDKVATCDREGRYKLGDPVADRLVAPGKSGAMPGPPV